MTEQPKISVVIPAWNAGPYLERCLDSIRQQTFTAFEVIIVDVDSTDDTAEIAQAYAEKDKRIKYYKYVFSPCGIARNFGIEKAISPYISFADADDSLEPDMLETMYTTAITENADIVVCDFNMVYPDKVISSFSRLKTDTFNLTNNSLADYYFRFSAGPKPNNYAWSRLYRKQFIEQTGIRFEHVLTSEDHLFNLMLSCSLPRITHVERAVYNYIQREDSSVRQTAKQTDQGIIYYAVFERARKFLENIEENYVSRILGIYAFTRIRSIVFYGQLAALSEDKLQASISSFLEGEKVIHYLSMCEINGYLSDYCRMHDIEKKQEQLFRELLHLCLQKEAIALDRGWFA